MPEITIIRIDEPVIELYKLLKLAGFASSGGEAKALIADGQVLLNDVTETRKRKKVAAGDAIALGTNIVQVARAKTAAQS